MRRSAGSWLIAGLGAPLLAALVVSVVEGAPARLPGVAMGSVVLLHAERAAALFALLLAVLTVLSHAANGRLPTQLGTTGLSYDAPSLVNADAVHALQREVDKLRQDVDVMMRAAVEANRSRG